MTWTTGWSRSLRPGRSGGRCGDDAYYVFDGDQVALEFSGAGRRTSSTGTCGAMRWISSRRRDSDFAGHGRHVIWPLTDNLGTSGTWQYHAANDTTTVANHRVYDSFGNLKSETNTAVDLLFGYTGRMLDEGTGLQNNLNRWYDPKVGRWLSEDPIGFEAGDPNLSICGE